MFDQANDYTWIVSPAIVDEYLKVLRRPILVHKYRDIETRNLAAMLELIATAVVVQPTAVPAVCRDPEDDKFLAAAKTGNATGGKVAQKLLAIFIEGIFAIGIDV